MDLGKLSLDALWTFNDTCSANPVLKERISAEIKSRIPQTNKFTREYLYSVNVIGKKALIIYFIPGTYSFEIFGRKIIVNMVMDEATGIELALNYASKPPTRTNGIVKAVSLVEWLNDEQRKHLRTTGFNTLDIMYCEWE